MPDTEDALAAALEGLMNGPEFALRVEEIANDWLLTDALRRNPVRPLNQLAQRDYPRRFFFREGAGNATCTPAAQGGAGCCSEEQDAAFCARGATLAAEQIAREPLELIAWLAAQDRSMKEILTYDRLRVSPFTAHVYGVQEIVDFPTGAADEARRPVSVQDTAYNNVSRNRAGTRALPHAGILSTLAVLNRYPSTDSNRQRTRAARLILERMLAVPVNQFADFVTSELDPDADLEQATQSAMPCIVCHTAMDPIAGHFDAFRSNLAFTPARVWPDYLPAPSFFDAAAPEDADLLPWLAAQVAEHPRFAYALVRPFFEGLTGHPVLSPPADLRDVDFAAKSAAFVAQNTYLTQLAERFATQHSHRLRPLLQDILTGPYFRAHHIDEDLAPEREAALAAAGIGGGLPLTNEQLHRKIRSATGFEWRVNGAPAGAEELRQRNRFAILYGGIDSDEITERFRTHFPVQLGIVRRMSYEMACLAVPRDFSIRQPAARRLFRHVSAATTETNDAPAIRAQIRRLQQILWGAYADDGDVELAAALQLFAAARAAGTAAQAAGEADPRLPGRCQVTQSWAPAGEATPYPATPAEGDTHERVVQDPQHVVRAWMAVFSYLLADPRFFQE